MTETQELNHFGSFRKGESKKLELDLYKIYRDEQSIIKTISEQVGQLLNSLRNIYHLLIIPLGRDARGLHGSLRIDEHFRLFRLEEQWPKVTLRLIPRS